jgi:hypothetical protein
LKKLAVALMFPISARCYGLHDLSGRSPSLLGGLTDVAGRKLLSGLA